MKMYTYVLLSSLFFASASTLGNSYVDALLTPSKLQESIAALQAMAQEIKDKHIKYAGNILLSSYYDCHTHQYRENRLHFYKPDGSLDDVNRYQNAYANLSNTHLLLATCDGALIGMLASFLSAITNSDLKKSSIGIAISSMLLTLLRSKKIGEVPYLDYITLSEEYSFFNTWSMIGTSLYTAAVGIASYLGSQCLIERLQNISKDAHA